MGSLALVMSDSIGRGTPSALSNDRIGLTSSVSGIAVVVVGEWPREDLVPRGMGAMTGGSSAWVRRIGEERSSTGDLPNREPDAMRHAVGGPIPGDTSPPPMLTGEKQSVEPV